MCTTWTQEREREKQYASKQTDIIMVLIILSEQSLLIEAG